MTEQTSPRPRVTVVIPCYNHAHFLQDALDSVLAQTFRDYEALVIDDGSSDDTRAVVASFSDPRIRYVWQENKGLSGARNTGIRTARGAYIALLDADDIWLPDFLETVVAHLDAHPSHGAVHTGCFFIDEVGRRLPQVSLTTAPAARMYDHLVEGEFFIPAAVLTRRECFERVGVFDESLRASEDWDMWLRVAREYPFGSLSQPLLNYRMHGSNMSGSPERMLHYQLAVVEKHFGSPEGSPVVWPPARQRSYGAVFRYAAQGFFLRGEIANGSDYLRRAFEANPALMGSLDSFYELACVDQPLGKRVAGPHIQVEQNEAVVRRALALIFERPNLDPRLAARKNEAYGSAYYALGLVAYGAGRLDLARRYLWRALRRRPLLLRERPLLVTWVKGWLGRDLLSRLKKARAARLVIS